LLSTLKLEYLITCYSGFTPC